MFCVTTSVNRTTRQHHGLSHKIEFFKMQRVGANLGGAKYAKLLSAFF